MTMGPSHICNDWEEGRDLLRKWREANVRESEMILQIWDELLSRNISKLGDEVYMIYEQVFVAALDCGHFTRSQKCLEQLHKQFPDSNRVKKLRAMQCESLGRFDDAEKIYNNILKADETNGVIRKRLVALLKSQNKYGEAIEELNRYLKKFQSDYEAWSELSDLYVREQDYAKAAFCLEELLLSSPYNHIHQQRYAEVKYSQGGQENVELARAYYCQSLHLNPDNMRSLYGLYLASNNLAASPRANSKKKKENLEYAQWAAKQIDSKFRELNDNDDDNVLVDDDDNDAHEIVTKMLSNLQVV